MFPVLVMSEAKPWASTGAHRCIVAFPSLFLLSCSQEDSARDKLVLTLTMCQESYPVSTVFTPSSIL